MLSIFWIALSHSDTKSWADSAHAPQFARSVWIILKTKDFRLEKKWKCILKTLTNHYCCQWENLSAVKWQEDVWVCILMITGDYFLF